MGKTWILVGHSSGIRIFQSLGPKSELSTVRETPFPWANLKGKDVVTDRPGQKFHQGEMPGRRQVTERDDPVEHNVELFAKEVADQLDKDRAAGKFDRLVLVSEPRFLGKLRHELSDHTRRMVEATLAKDLAEAGSAQVREALADTILV